MARSDGSIIIDTRVDADGFGKGVKSMKSQIGGLTSAVGKLGAAIGLAFGVKALVDFGKSAIDLGSDLQEVQNVVDVVFGNMNKEINDFSKNALEKFGLSEYAAKQYSSTLGAMLKSFGFITSDAKEMSLVLTGLAGDMASFYNLDSSDAFAKLRAGISGETEPLKQLGINLSVANLEQFAFANGITKTYDSMSELEKVILRYNFILDATKQAQGDFVRTSASWANQNRILSETFNDFKRNIGQALINIFTPFLKVLNQIVSKMAQLSQRFVAFSEMLVGKSTSGGGGSPGIAEQYGDIAENTELAASGVNDFTDSVKKASKEAKKSLSPLDNLNNLTSGMAENLGDAGYGDISIAKADSSINIEGEEEVSRFEAMLTSLADKIAYVKDIVVGIYEKYIKKTFLSFINNVREMGSTINEWFVGKIIPIFEKLRDRFTQIVEEKIRPLFEKLIGLVSKLWNEMLKPFIDWVGEKLGTFLPPLIEGFGTAFLNAFEKAIDIADSLIEALSGLIDFIVGVFTGDWERAWESLVSAFEKIVKAITKFFEGLFGWIFESLGIIAENIKGLFDDGKGGGVLVPQTPKVQVPHLATGAVLPPNAPFMAMLGDQRNGRNLEAPEGLIRQIMREELAQLSISNNNRPLIVEISGKEIFRIVQDEADEYFETTGREAFP